MFFRRDKVVLEGELVSESLVAFPDRVDILGLVLFARDFLVQVDFQERFGLRSLVTADIDTDMVTDLGCLAILGVIDRETKAAPEVIRVVDRLILQVLGVIADAVRVGVDRSRDLEGVRSLDTVRTVHAVHVVGDPDTVKIWVMSVL